MKISIVGLAAAALLCTSAVAQADPVSITSGGWLNATFEDCGAVTLVSDQFNVHAGWECLNGGFGPLTSGAVINLTTTTTASQSVLGTGTVAGVSYDFRTPLSFAGTTLRFDVPTTITLPANAAAATTLNFALPFTMTGFLTLTPVSEFSPVPTSAPILTWVPVPAWAAVPTWALVPT